MSFKIEIYDNDDSVKSQNPFENPTIIKSWIGEFHQKIARRHMDTVWILTL